MENNQVQNEVNNTVQPVVEMPETELPSLAQPVEEVTYEAVQPVVEMPQPVQEMTYEAVQPVVEMPQPIQEVTYEAVQPVVEMPQPVQEVTYEAVQPVVEMPQPVQEVTYEAAQPVTYANEQGAEAISNESQTPLTENVEPVINNKTNIEYNSQEKVLFEIEPEKEGNPIGTLIIFLVLGMGLFCLPFADNFINKGSGRSVLDIFNKEDEIINNNNLNDTYYFENGQSSIGIGEIELKNFVTQETDTGYKINFTIINNSSAAYRFDKKYYIDFYEDEKVLYHAILHSYNAVASKAAANMSLEISERAYKRANSIKIVERKIDLYPNYKFDTKEGDYDTITCTYGKSEIIYYFKNNMLEQIRETYTNKDYESSTYEKDKSNKLSEINAYRQIEGFNANMIETETEFTAQIDFLLADIVDSSLANLKVYRFFKFHEKANVVAYEMSSIGYICS